MKIALLMGAIVLSSMTAAAAAPGQNGPRYETQGDYIYRCFEDVCVGDDLYLENPLVSRVDKNFSEPLRVRKFVRRWGDGPLTGNAKVDVPLAVVETKDGEELVVDSRNGYLRNQEISCIEVQRDVQVCKGDTIPIPLYKKYEIASDARAKIESYIEKYQTLPEAKVLLILEHPEYQNSIFHVQVDLKSEQLKLNLKKGKYGKNQVFLNKAGLCLEGTNFCVGSTFTTFYGEQVRLRYINPGNGFYLPEFRGIDRKPEGDVYFADSLILLSRSDLLTTNFNENWGPKVPSKAFESKESNQKKIIAKIHQSATEKCLKNTFGRQRLKEAPRVTFNSCEKENGSGFGGGPVPVLPDPLDLARFHYTCDVQVEFTCVDKSFFGGK